MDNVILFNAKQTKITEMKMKLHDGNVFPLSEEIGTQTSTAATTMTDAAAITTTKATATSAVVLATGSSFPQESGYCVYNGNNYAVNEKIEDGCETICTCMDKTGRIECEPRCSKMNHTTSEQCVTVADPNDVCCQIELCDVTLNDHESTMTESTNDNTTTAQQNNRNEHSKNSTAASGNDEVYHCVHKERKYKKGI